MSFPVLSAPSSPLPLVELMGRLCLAQVDVAQRLQYLACRLSVGLADSCLRRQLLRRDDSCCVADQVELEERIALLMEAGGEGLVTILGAFIEELTQAHTQCIEASFAAAGVAPLARLPHLPGASLALRVPAAARAFNARG